MEPRRRIAALALLAALAAPVSAAGAHDGDEELSRNPIVIIGTVLTNIVYMPAKIIYATLGGVTGAIAFAVTGGDTDTSQAIWDAACRGTYVITPTMLEGKDSARFSGP